MKMSIWAGVIAVSVIVPSVSSAQSGPYRFGDTPYRLNWDYEPQIQSGCWKWNWQQYQWDDTCPVFVNPKAYMYPRASRAALRVKRARALFRSDGFDRFLTRSSRETVATRIRCGAESAIARKPAAELYPRLA